MRRPFSAAVDLFRLMETKTNDLIYSVLKLEGQQILASESCPACFGPSPPNSADYPESTRNKLIICLDGNFQHRHHAKASRNYEQLRTPRVFIPQDEVDRVNVFIREKEKLNKPKDKVLPLSFEY
jgi:hypothetical protein